MTEANYLVAWWVSLAGLAALLTQASRSQPPWNLFRRILAAGCALVGLVGIPYGVLLFFLWRADSDQPISGVLASYLAPLALLLFWIAVLPVSVRAGGRGPIRLMWASLVCLTIAFVPIVAGYLA